jgi:hypothetical protein
MLLNPYRFGNAGTMAGSAALAFSLAGSMDAGAAMAGSAAITFTPTAVMAAVDANFASVVLLLHGDGADGSTTATNSASTGHVMSANGNAQIDTAQFKFGGASMLFDGTGDFWAMANHADMNFPGDFTIEAWIRFASVAADAVICGNYQNSTNGWTLQLYLGKLCFFATGDGVDSQGTTTVSANTWYHVAVSRTGSTLKLFLDGVQEDSDTNSASLTSTANFCVGRTGSVAGAYMNGWIDDLRITKGVGRYTGTFSVPAAAFPNS